MMFANFSLSLKSDFFGLRVSRLRIFLALGRYNQWWANLY